MFSELKTSKIFSLWFGHIKVKVMIEVRDKKETRKFSREFRSKSDGRRTDDGRKVTRKFGRESRSKTDGRGTDGRRTEFLFSDVSERQKLSFLRRF